MRIYKYRVGSNGYKKVSKFDPYKYAALAGVSVYSFFIIGFAVPKSIHETNESYLRQFTFGQFPALAVAAEPKVAGTSAIIKKPETKEEIIAASKYPEQIDHIWLKETSRGTNTNPNALHNICKAKGKSNEFGYGGMQNMWCFDSFEEAVRVVEQWLDKQTAEALCYYNIGIKTSNCQYVK